MVVDDSGTPGDEGDDVTVCTGLTLIEGQTTSCSRSNVTLSETRTSVATVTGQDPLSNDVTANDDVTVNVISPGIEVVVTSDQAVIYAGEAVTYTYRITNTGDVTLTGVTVVDDNGTPGDEGDDTSGQA